MRATPEFMPSAVFEGTTDAVYVKDEELRYLMINRELAERLGRPREKILGRRISDFFPGEQSRAIEESERGLLRSGRVETRENELDSRGKRRTFLSTKGPVLDAEGRVSGLFGISREITELKEHERLRESIVHHVNHELRTPLSTGGMALALLAERTGLDPESRRLVEIARDSLHHLERMTQDLLEATKADTGKLKVEAAPGDLSASLSSLVEALAPVAAKRGIALSLSAPAGLRARFDPTRLRQVVSNLVDNALKFTPSGGRVELSARAGEGWAELAIADTGPGLQKAELGRVFDRLYQTANKALHGQAGLGLGLHVCKELVQAHGGRIWVESEPGRGTTFRFTLPAA